jgi:hypothetical protein
MSILTGVTVDTDADLLDFLLADEDEEIALGGIIYDEIFRWINAHRKQGYIIVVADTFTRKHVWRLPEPFQIHARFIDKKLAMLCKLRFGGAA